MIGEGYGNMKELAAEMRKVQASVVLARMDSETQKGELIGSENSLNLVLK